MHKYPATQKSGVFFDASKPELTDLFGVNMQVRIPYRSHPGRLVAVP